MESYGNPLSADGGPDRRTSAVYNRIYSPRMLAAQVLASLMLHFPGLDAFIQFSPNTTMILLAIGGASIEGVFMISLLYILWIQQRLLPCFLAIVLSGTSLFCMFGDYWFRTKSEGEHPDMWMIMSGFKSPETYLGGELENADSSMLVPALMDHMRNTTIAAAMMVITARQQARRSKHPRSSMSSRQKLLCYFSTLFVAMACLYALGAWMPVFHVFASVAGGLIFNPPGSLAAELQQSLQIGQVERPKSGNFPNVVVIVHESLSGELMTNTSEFNVPFYAKMASSKNQGYYVFENARSMSGDTVDCLTAIQSGCLPLDGKEGLKMALSATIATAFKSAGYDTVSLTSYRPEKLKGTKWHMMYNQLALNFDKVYGTRKKKSTHHDKKTVQNFDKWLGSRSANKTTEKFPFYAQFYMWDSHYPYVNDPEISKTEETGPGMLTTVDNNTASIFQILEEAGKLDNTVVLGMGDHGEIEYGGGKYGRLVRWTSGVLNPLMYMYVPKGLLQDESVAATLSHNTKQLVSIVDVYPTLMRLIGGHQGYPGTNVHCIRGVNLFDTPIEDNRVTWSMTSVSKDVNNLENANMALHKGVSSSLYRRWSAEGMEFLHYSENAYVPKNGTSNKKVPINDLSEWKSILLNLTGHGPESSVWQSNSKYSTSFLADLGLKWDASLKEIVEI